MKFTVKLAGIPVGVEALFESTQSFCGEYLTEEEPAFTVTSGISEIAAERRRSEEDDLASGCTIHSYTDSYLETLAVYRQIAEAMTERDVLLFHGSVIAVDGAAYLFTAPSGTGKSTHARLWREVLPKYGHDVFMVNDDKPLLKFTGDAILACGTPWDGKHHLSTNCMVPLRGICSLMRGEENEIHRLPPNEAWPVFMRQCFRPEKMEHMAATLRLLDRMSRELPLYELHCNMESEAALVSWNGMTERGT